MTLYSPDPFTQMLTALWACLNASTAVTNKVAVGNEIMFVNQLQNRAPLKDTLQAGDVPQLALEPAAWNAHLFNTSNSTEVTQTVALSVRTGDQRLDAYSFPMKWAILCALSTSKGASPYFLGLPFVKNVRPGAATDLLQQKAEDGPKGWSFVLSIDVYMWFLTSDLQAGA